ncbi:MAG: D-glycerate dehydrogenase [Candidatus Acidiferrales bacterium]|jgi:lactate dehydrogenase-like 2-hydroxyacid dehydrogenase
MKKASVYVTRMIPQENIDELRKHFDVEVHLEDRGLTKAELKERAKGCHAIISLITDTIDGELLDAVGSQCKIVANYAVGINNFDVAAATKRGVILTNTPGVLDDATATHTFALLLAAARRLVEADNYVRDGKWKGWSPMFFIGMDVDRRTLGIAGMGRIGANVARKARAFDMKIIYSSLHRNPRAEQELGATYVDKETLLKESDFLTLHVPLTPETRHYIGAKELKLMKRTAVLINASRGPVVDENALFQALQEKQIWAAGLDVFENEPEIVPGLAKLDNVVVVPHIASATPETRINMGKIAVNNIVQVLNGQPPETCVNPEVLEN